MRRLLQIALLLMIIPVVLLSPVLAQDVTADVPVGPVNLRAGYGTDFDIVGEITSGTRYTVVARSARFPWLLLADPTTGQRLGWVYETLVTINGNISNLPFSDEIIVPGATPIPTPLPQVPAPISPTPTLATSPDDTATLMPTPTPAFTVSGTVQGEVNIRYGPGTQYERVGVAQSGDRFEITAYHTQYPWVQIRYANAPRERAWIAESLLEIDGNVLSLPALSDANLALPTLTPTPSVLSASSLSGDAIPLSAGFAALGNQLWQIVLENGFDLETSKFGALFLLDLQTGEAITFGGDIAFSGTSVNKIAILARLYGILNVPPTETIATDIANTMICSENAATNRLMSIIGGGDEFAGAAEITRFMQQIGMESSFLTSPYIVDPENPPEPPRPIELPQTEANQEKANPDTTNQLTVEDMGWLLSSIYQCAYQNSGPLLEYYSGEYEPRECRQMLHVMANNNVDALLKAGVPADTRVAHKHGWIADTHSNAALFFTPGGDYVIVMMMFEPEWLNFQESLPVIAEVSRTVYNYYNPAAPQPEIREGFIPDAPSCNFAGTPLISDLRQPIWDE